MYILGISGHYHDSAAVLLKDGVIIAAMEEERLTRKKHDNAFPFQAIDWCLKSNNLRIENISYIAYYEKPLLKFERILETFVETYPFSLLPFLKAIPEWLSDKIKIEHLIKKKLKYKNKVLFIPHHISHAASTFYPSPFKKSAILTIDGVGEYQTTGLWLGDDAIITPLSSISFPQSIGLLYSTFTSFLGFQVNNDEYKMMGLSAYGKPKYKNLVYKVISVKNDGSFQLNMNYFRYRESFQMWSKEFETLLGLPRKKDEKFTQRHKDLAASIQRVVEEIYVKMLRHLYALSKTENLCISGGVALNSLANGLIYSQTPFKNVYIFGPAGDSAAAVGAALYAHHQMSRNNKRQIINQLLLGSVYSDTTIENFLKKYNLAYKKLDADTLVKETAQMLIENKVIGWFQGKMEFGPRALGARSIIANPKEKNMKEKVNNIKMREQFRPFAASVLQDKVQELFEVPEPNHHSPFMNFVFQVKPKAVNKIASIVHADNTCRIQTVNEKDNPLYYKLIHRFYELTDTPCVLNTSFNTKIEPIVESPEQAIKDFITTKMDALVIGRFIVERPNNRK